MQLVGVFVRQRGTRDVPHDGVGYVLKGCEAEYQRAGGDFYETKKFGGNCDVMLSESVFRVLAGRRQIGKRRRQGQREAE